MIRFGAMHQPLWKYILLACGTAALVLLSRRSLLAPRSHGFFRFFAWECILILFTLNVEFWFADPLTWNQTIAWLLLFASLIPLFFGVHSLRTRGRPVQRREEDPSLLAFEKTTELVTTGIYRYIRHPLYSSLLFLDWGIFFKRPSIAGAIPALLAAGFLLLTARADESECRSFFGERYQEYMRRTKMFIPYLF